MENIKDFLVMNNTEKKKVTKRNIEINYTYKLSYNNKIDFIIDKYRNGKLYKQLVVIPSEKLMYIRDKNGDSFANSSVLSGFFRQMSRDEYNEIMSQVNEFYTEFGVWEKIYYKLSLLQDIWKSTYNSDKYKYELIKRGFNPPSYCSNSDKYLSNIDLYVKILKKINELSLKLNSDEIGVLFDIGNSINYNNALYILNKKQNSDLKINCYYSYNTISMISLIKEYNLDFNTFIDYLFDNLYFQGIAEFDNEIVRIYEDYLNMQKVMYNKILDKYPDSLKLQHDKLVMKFNLHKQYYQEKAIEMNIEKIKELEYKNDKYCIILPKSSQDIIDEGINLHHCVGSYVPKVQRGETNILFMRTIEEPETSLITIEYTNESIEMVRGLQNRYVNDEEKEFIQKWAKNKKIKINDSSCL